jgi:transposase
MKTPIFVGPLSKKERQRLRKGLRSKDAFTMRRAQILLASSEGERAPKIALNLGCASQTARDAINDFNERGFDSLRAKSSPPRRRTREAFDERSAEALREMLHRSPREFGRESSLWTLQMAADVAFEEGLTAKSASRGRRYVRGFRASSGFGGCGRSVGEALDHLLRPLVRKKKG